jgi:hypothetical protein
MARAHSPNKAERERRHRLYASVKAERAEFPAREVEVPES